MKKKNKFKIKVGCYLEFLMPKTIKLPININKVTKDRNRNSKNLPHLEIIEVILVHCNVFKRYYCKDSRELFLIVPNKPFVQLLKISPTNDMRTKFPTNLTKVLQILVSLNKLLILMF